MTLHRDARGQSVIKTHRAQRSFGDGLIAAEVADLHEVWMRQADRVLDDPQIVAPVYEALAQRRPNSRSRGRPGSPAEVVLRLLVLKHVRNWSYEVLEREVRANLVYRDFTRVGGGKVPDAKTMGRWGMALGPAPIAQIHDRIVGIAQAERVVQGRRMRIDTTVVETNIHYPTDSSLLGDGVRVLTRTMKKVAGLTKGAGARLRDRSRSVKFRLLEIARAARGKVPNRAKMAQAYRRLLDTTARVVGQARRFAGEITQGVKRVCIPNHATKSAARKREQKKRWFRSGQKWRTGCEGRISVIKRRHGLARSRYRGDDGMKRWVGLGVIADNLLSIARASPKPKKPAR